MVFTLYGCGYNGFKQISGFRQVSLDGWATNCERNNVSKHDEMPAVLSPITWLLLHENIQVQNVVFSWAHIAVVLTKDGEMMSVIAGCLNPTSPTASKVYGEVVCATESHFVLRQNGKKEPCFESLCGENFQPKPLVMKEHDQAVTSVFHVNASHNDLYYTRGNLEFGRLTSQQMDEGEKFPKVVCLCPLDMSLRIDRISCGREHVLLLSSFGCVYSFGLGSRGQLGHGDVEMETTPRLIEALEGVRMQDVQAGGWHSASVSESGDVYTWGWNESGQLGIASLGPNNTRDGHCQLGLLTEPECVTLPSEAPIMAVACGSRHTLVVSECGQVFASGWNRYGQLGLMHKRDQYTFVRVSSLKSPCRQIFAGHWCSVFLCKDLYLKSIKV